MTADLSAHRNNVGCALPGQDIGDGFDGYGRAFPAEVLAAPGHPWGTGALATHAGAPDNVSCEGQRIDLTHPVRAGSLQVFGACTNGSFRERLRLLPAGEGRPVEVPLALSDWLAARGSFGETPVVRATPLREHGRDVPGPRPTVWRFDIPLPEPTALSAFVLPFHPDIHVFAVTLTAAREGAR